MKIVFETPKTSFDPLKRGLSLRYPIKGLMTSKDTGHFLSLLPGSETPASLHHAPSPVWPQMDVSPGKRPPPRPGGKSCTLTKTEPLGSGSDLICAGRKKKNPKNLPSVLLLQRRRKVLLPPYVHSDASLSGS